MTGLWQNSYFSIERSQVKILSIFEYSVAIPLAKPSSWRKPVPSSGTYNGVVDDDENDDKNNFNFCTMCDDFIYCTYITYNK